MTFMNLFSGKRVADFNGVMSLVVLLILLNLVAFANGRESSSVNSGLIAFVQGHPSANPRVTVPAIQESFMPMSRRFAPSELPEPWTAKSSLGPAPSPAPPTFQGSAARPRSRSSLKHHHHRKGSHAASPTPSTISGSQESLEGCHNTCLEPLISAPMGSPCGCVLPMQVKLHLGVSPYVVLFRSQELAIEVASGTFLKQSQVSIRGASAAGRDLEKAVVDFELVPLVDKFDNTTALLISERFLKKKVLINMTLFGDYEVIYVHYPGLQSSATWNDPSGGQEHPVAAIVLGNSQKNYVRTIVIVTLSALVVFLVWFATISIFIISEVCRRPSTAIGPVTTPIARGPGSTEPSLISSMATCTLSVKAFSLAELEKATEKFSSKRILGEGGSGLVYHGILEDGTEVAVKLLKREDRNGYCELISEVNMLSRLHHRNLVKLIGICLEEHPRCLVYEFVHNGSIESHLHGSNKKKKPLDWDARMKIALGAARGLAYLHEDSNPLVIHRDFKTSNILLEDDFTPKISDFGLAREVIEGSDHISTRVMGTFGYIAPEYAMAGHLFIRSDVYSYGVVLLELLSGRIPVDMSQPEGQEHLVTWARRLLRSREGLEQLADPTLAGNYDIDSMARVAAIALMCVHLEVAQRPFMGEVVQALKLINNDMDDACGDCSPFGGNPHNASNVTPPLPQKYTSSLITMEFNSSPLEEIDNKPTKPFSKSGPLRTTCKPNFYGLRGSVSDHELLSRHAWSDGY